MNRRNIYEETATLSHDYILIGYHHMRRFELTLEFLSDILKESLNTRTHTLIDIGCGDGFLDKLIDKRFRDSIEIVGMDISRTRIRRAQQRVPNSSFILADIYHLPFRKSFNISIVSQVVEHLCRPQAALQEIHRILMNNGHLLLDAPSKTNIIDMFLRLIRREPTWGLRIEKTHLAFYDEESMQRLLRSTGFDIIEVRGVSFLRYDLLSILSITWDSRKWQLPRLIDSFAQRFAVLRSKGAIQLFKCHPTNVKAESIENSDLKPTLTVQD